MKSIDTLDQVVDELADSIIKRDYAMLHEPKRVVDKYADRAVHGIIEILKRGDEGREAVSKLLKHSDDGVRAEAAMLVLGYKTEEALAVLQDVAKNTGLIGGGARAILKRWQQNPKRLELGEFCVKPD